MAKRTTHRKTSPRAYRSAALAAIHENMADLHEAGAIDTKTIPG
jgi:DNA-binding transcriptional regulator YiaG